MPTKKAPSWDAIPGETVRPGVSRKGFASDKVMLVMNECQPGMALNPHSHTFEQVVYIVKGKCRYHVGDIAYEMEPGSVLVVPTGVIHYIEPVGDEAVLNLDVFAPPRADYRHLTEWQNAPET